MWGKFTNGPDWVIFKTLLDSKNKEAREQELKAQRDLSRQKQKFCLSHIARQRTHTRAIGYK